MKSARLLGIAARGALGLALAAAFALQAGCAGRFQSETVVIPEAAATTAGADGASSTFEVQSIFKLPFGETIAGSPLGWADGDRLIGYKNAGGLQFVSFAAPYRDPAALDGFFVAAPGLSPDGRFLSGIAKDDGSFVLRLLAADDGRDVAKIPSEGIDWRQRRFTWSDNSRYLAYGVRDTGARADSIAVYDTETGGTASYKLSGGALRSAWIASVKLSNDGAKALVVYEADEGARDESPAQSRSGVMLAERSGDAYESRYEHSLGSSGSADWLNDNQFAFAGADDTLFGYDARNGALTVLADRTGLFRLSPDKQAIAFSRSDDTVLAGRVQGNNILNESVVYQGIVPALLAWSPDNGMLLIEGAKPYTRKQTAVEPYVQTRPEAVPAPAESDDGYASFVLQFR